ncbi:MAG: putative ubiquitin-RnfH superfamily antitoxin RatB of RatAB toxin-antitoxin module [Mariniflexile sp.]|jgi:putative ubiquitin-RnfH superfamily antitoxin RatB of RatAB toxin-antitoxin module
MNPTNFTYILQNPQAITHSQTEVVKSIIDEFPYFQSARSIYLKGLKNENSFKYNQELKITAAYTTDRSILFDFITSEVFIQNEISQFIKQNTEHLKDIEIDVEDISINKSIQIDDALRQQIKDTINVFDPILFEPKEERQKNITSFVLDESKTIEPVTENSKTQEASANDLLNLGKPLEFDRKETHSFNEWLKLARISLIERQEDSSENSAELETSLTTDKSKKFKLIDKFITENPKIKPLKTSSSKVNLAEAQMIQPEALMTETLARIYVEQKNYKKAIQSYKILSLKYPEKSSSFANQIKAIEQLQEQNNKK